VSDNTWVVRSVGCAESAWIGEVLLSGRVEDTLKSGADFHQGRTLVRYLSSEKWVDSKVSEAIRELGPIGIIHGGDKHLRHKSRNYGQAPIVIREHFNPMMRKKGLYFIPVGWRESFFRALKGSSSPSQTTVLWSFVGRRRPDRKTMLENFYSLGPHTVVLNKGTSGSVNRVSDIKLAEIYRASSFVLCPFGGSAPDTGRIMEALEAGAIPVTVAFRRIDYFRFVFGDHPFIVGSDWGEATAKVKSLSENPEQLDELRQKCQAWYSNYLVTLHKDIEILLSSDLDRTLQSRQIFYQQNARRSPRTVWKFWVHFRLPSLQKQVVSTLARALPQRFVQAGVVAFRTVVSQFRNTKKTRLVDRENLIPPELPDRPRREGPESIFDELPVSKFYGNSSSDTVLNRRGFNTKVIGTRVPAFFINFDWVVGPEWGFANLRQVPNSVFCAVEGLEPFLEWLDNDYLPQRAPSNQDPFCEVLVLGQSDTRLGKISPEVRSRAKQLFSRLYIQANDGSDPNVFTFPMAISQHYLNGHEATLRGLVESPPEKTNLVLASWGKAWPHLNASIPDRRAAVDFVESSSWLDLEYLPTDQYLRRLATSRYMLYPQGNGIQSPKGYEALLLGAIPIVTEHPAFRELSDRGMPLLIVKSWTDLSEDFLEEKYEEFSGKVREFGPTARSHRKFYNFSCGFPDFT
jgi:hypothetical protein